MNPTITTGTASYMGVSGPDHHHKLKVQPIWEREAKQLPWASRTPTAADDEPGQRPAAETKKIEASDEEGKSKGFPKLKLKLKR